MKRNFFRKIKRKCNNELKRYYRNMNILYEIFNDSHITDNESEIFDFIQSMSISEIEEMFDGIIVYFHKFDMENVIYEPIILKLAVMVYIQKMRKGEKIET